MGSGGAVSPARRWTLKSALAFTRSARTATAKTAIRYGRNELAAAAIARAMKAINSAERELLKARRLVVETKRRRVAA